MSDLFPVSPPPELAQVIPSNLPGMGEWQDIFGFNSYQQALQDLQGANYGAAGINIGRDIGNWYSDTVHTIGNITRSIENWTHQAIDLAIAGVTRAFDDVVSGLRWGIRHAGDVADALYRDVRGALNLLGRTLHDAINRVRSDANTWVQDAVHAASAGIVNAEHLVSGWVGDAEHLARDALSTFVNDVFDPVKHFVDHADEWWNTLVDHWWSTITRDVVDPIISTLTGAVHWIEHEGATALHDIAVAADWIGHEGARAYDFAVHEGLTAAHAVEAAGEWIAWFGAHTISDLEHLGTDLSKDVSLGYIRTYVEQSMGGLVAEARALADALMAP